MNPARRVTLALVLSASTWPAVAATAYFWNCTKPDGTKYGEASQCDKGDSAVKVMKNERVAVAGMGQMVLAAQRTDAVLDTPTTGVCPTNPAYCARPDYGVTDGSPRAQAITQFMRNRECALMRRFPERCVRRY